MDNPETSATPAHKTQDEDQNTHTNIHAHKTHTQTYTHTKQTHKANTQKTLQHNTEN